MISIDKKYQTRNGNPVRILCVDNEDKDYPVVTSSEGVINSYTKYGKFYSGTDMEDSLDLIELPDATTVDVYIGIYKDTNGIIDSAYWQSKVHFDDWVENSRDAIIATKKVTFDVQHGEFYEG